MVSYRRSISESRRGSMERTLAMNHSIRYADKDAHLAAVYEFIKVHKFDYNFKKFWKREPPKGIMRPFIKMDGRNPDIAYRLNLHKNNDCTNKFCVLTTDFSFTVYDGPKISCTETYARCYMIIAHVWFCNHKQTACRITDYRIQVLSYIQFKCFEDAGQFLSAHI